MREKEVATKSRNIQATVYSASEVQRRHFCVTCMGTDNRGTCCYTDLDLRNDGNRPSLTRGAVSRTSRSIIEKHDR